jgi:hypothetical protein
LIPVTNAMAQRPIAMVRACVPSDPRKVEFLRRREAETRGMMP